MRAFRATGESKTRANKANGRYLNVNDGTDDGGDLADVLLGSGSSSGGILAVVWIRWERINV